MVAGFFGITLVSIGITLVVNPSIKPAYILYTIFDIG